MSSTSQPDYRRVPRSLRILPIETVRRLALSATQDDRASDANEWYWVMRFGHTLYRTIHWNVFLGSAWRYARDLSQSERSDLTCDDLAVLALSESSNGRAVAAKHELTPPASLALLARDGQRDVYRAAGHNLATPAEAIAFMRSWNRTEDISVDRLRFLWSEVATYERIDDKLAMDVARGYHGDDRQIALARRGSNQGALIELAGSYSLPEEAAMVLADHGSEAVRAALAKNDIAVSDALLERLSTDTSLEVRRAVIENRRLPEAALIQLLDDQRLRSTVITRGHLSFSQLVALQADAVTRQDLIDRLDNNTAGWGRNRDAPPKDFVELLRVWAQSPDETTRMAVARNAASPLDLLEKLAEDKALAPHVARGLGTSIANDDFSDGYQYSTVGWYRRSLSESELSYMASSPSATLRAARAHRHGADAAAMDQLASDSDPSVRAAVACSEWASFDQLQALANDEQERVRRSASRTICDLLRREQDPDEGWSGEWLRELTDPPLHFPTGYDGRVDMSLMSRVCRPGQRSWRVSPSRLDLLARSKDVSVREAVASFHARVDGLSTPRPDLTEQALLELLVDPEEAVRKAAYGNVGRTAASVAGREDTPVDALIEFSRSTSDDVRSAVAGNKDAPGPVLANLARDRSARVRAAVAANRSTPTPALVALSRDDSEKVLLSLLSNSCAPATFIAEQADRAEGQSRWQRQLAAAANPASPADVLRKLGYSERADVRQLVAQHPATPADSLEILSLDEESSVRDAASRPARPLEDAFGE